MALGVMHGVSTFDSIRKLSSNVTVAHVVPRCSRVSRKLQMPQVMTNCGCGCLGTISSVENRMAATGGTVGHLRNFGMSQPIT
jgi:hypothetical protein